ncbi:MAG: hypothetical protein WCG50_14390 [Rhodoferax sp.]|uniref:hypothetical protein n=1 Tax=Rhodoferax sp. TaxID=50421 RepID=UPI003017C312
MSAATNKAANAAPDIDAAVNTVNELVETLSEKFFYLGKVTQMAAFAAEARRTLELYSSQADYFPDFKNSLKNCNESVNNWRSFDDTSGDVLQQIACQIDACANELNMGIQCVRDLRRLRMKDAKSTAPDRPEQT